MPFAEDVQLESGLAAGGASEVSQRENRHHVERTGFYDWRERCFLGCFLP